MSSLSSETWILRWVRGELTVTPYLRAIPCRVSLSVTRCSTYFSPREAVTLAVLPYERILVRARLWDSSLSDSEPDLDRGKMGCAKRPPPSPTVRTGENPAIFPWLKKVPSAAPLTPRLSRRCWIKREFRLRGEFHPRPCPASQPRGQEACLEERSGICIERFDANTQENVSLERQSHCFRLHVQNNSPHKNLKWVEIRICFVGWLVVLM